MIDTLTLEHDDRTALERSRQTGEEHVRAARWRPSALTLTITVLALGGLAAGLYPMTAAWLSSYNQSRVLVGYHEQLADVDPDVATQVSQAHEYNAALTAGVVLEANGNVPVSDGTLTGSELEYGRILTASADGLMARVKIPSIGVDLPIYHGTSDAVLERGAGHLAGSHFPVGGAGTHSVITAHRGLANATMFSNLDDVAVGDTFTIETFGEVLTYRVRETYVIDPSDTDRIRAVPGEDLVTLITCTPLGINTHRILVTGERITPTPIGDELAAGAAPTVPGFPWWAVFGGAGIALVGTYGVLQGRIDARVRSRGA